MSSTQPTVMNIEEGRVQIIATQTNGTLGAARLLLCAELEEILNEMDDMSSTAIINLMHRIRKP